MKKRLILFYLLLCVTVPLQAGIRDKIVRVLANKPAASVPRAAVSTGNAALHTTANSAANTALGKNAVTALPQLGNIGEIPPVFVPDMSASSLQIYNTLKNYADQTYQQAIRAQEKLSNPSRILGYPVKFDGLSSFPLKSKEIYPDKPFLHKGLLSPLLTKFYFLAESNRLYIQHLHQMQEFWPTFNDAIPRFYKEAEAVVQPQEDKLVEWAAAQIPANVKVLGIGETHGYREIPHFIADLLELISAQMDAQGRKVILFTEFLHNPDTPSHLLSSRWHLTYDSYYETVWRRAENFLGIEVVGLEDRYVTPNPSTVQVYVDEDSTDTWPLWATMEGVRIRNEHWYTLLQKYRQENPDALFIIYAGNGHLLYNHPFSVLSQFAKEETFMISLSPDVIYNAGDIIYKTDPLEKLNANLSFPQLAIKWESPDLIQLSGYDIRVRLPIDIKAKIVDMENWGIKE